MFSKYFKIDLFFYSKKILNLWVKNVLKFQYALCILFKQKTLPLSFYQIKKEKKPVSQKTSNVIHLFI